MDSIHIFLDTTLTYDDPFFKKNYNHQLIRLSEIYEFPIYMSRIVFEETRNKFESNVNDRIGALDKALLDLENYHPSKLNSVEINCSLNDFLKEFDQHYSELFTKGIIQIIEYDNNLLPTLIERSIKKIKPFTKKKQEFRDAITWLSYVDYVEKNQLENCFLVTANVSDFCDNNMKNTIHPDLLTDSKRFSHYVSSHDLFEHERKISPYMEGANVREWLIENSINKDFVLDKFENNFSHKLNDYFINYDSDNLLNVSLYRDMWISVDSVMLGDIEEEIIATVIKDQIVVDGDLFVTLEISVHVEDEFGDTRMIGTESAQIVSAYTFTMDTKKIYEDTLEFTAIDVIDKADFRRHFQD